MRWLGSAPFVETWTTRRSSADQGSRRAARLLRLPCRALTHDEFVLSDNRIRAYRWCVNQAILANSGEAQQAQSGLHRDHSRAYSRASIQVTSVGHPRRRASATQSPLPRKPMFDTVRPNYGHSVVDGAYKRVRWEGDHTRVKV